jgi:hypothetical protein
MLERASSRFALRACMGMSRPDGTFHRRMRDRCRYIIDGGPRMPSCLSAMRRASLLAMGAALAEPANASVHAVHPDRPPPLDGALSDRRRREEPTCTRLRATLARSSEHQTQRAGVAQSKGIR